MKSHKGGRVHTRKQLKSRRRSYARRVKASHCRGKGPATCRRTSGCKTASGKSRKFCRKSRNMRRHK